MSEYEQVIDEIVKHGVVVKVNKIVDDNYIPYERKYVGCVVELDFSERDKVFEGKIAELEKEVVNYKQAFKDKCADYGVASELLEKYQRENEALKKRIQELDAIDAMRIDEKRELKQRIAELKSKETEKPTKINLNDRIKVKLTPLGAEIYYHQYDDINKRQGENTIEPSMQKIDEKGYTEFQLHHFISLYGQHIRIGKPNVIDPIDIIACE